MSFGRINPGAFCGVAGLGAGPSGSSATGIPTIDGVLPLALMAAGFVGAGVWMFRRWGKRPAGQAAPEENSPQPVPPQNEDGLATT